MTGKAKRGKMDWDDGAAWAGALDLLYCAVLWWAAQLLHCYISLLNYLKAQTRFFRNDIFFGL